MPPGVFSQEVKNIHTTEIDVSMEIPGLQFHFHSNPWCQGPSVGHSVQYKLGGNGTKENPGIQWWYDYLEKSTKERIGDE